MSQKDQSQIYRSVHQTAQAGVIRIIFFMVTLVWYFNRRLLKNWLKHTYSRH